MKRSLLTLLISFSILSVSSAQQLWNKYYTSNSGGFLPIIFDIEQTHDDQIFLIGSELFGDYTVFKINKHSGDTIWTKTDSTTTKILRIPNSDDYYILRGDDIFVASENWLSRVDSALNTVWKRDFELNSEQIVDMEVLSDGSAICFGNYFAGGFGVERFFRRVDENNNIILFDTTLSEISNLEMSPNIEVLPNDKFILSRMQDTVMTFYRYSSMGVFEDSAKVTLPGIPWEEQVNFAINKWDGAIGVMGTLEYDTTNVDSLDIAGYYYELDSNLNVTLASEDTNRIFTGAPGFYTLGGSVRAQVNKYDTAGVYSLGLYFGTSLSWDFPLGASGMGFPNIPYAIEYIAPIQYVVAGSDFMNFWATSFTTFINNIGMEIDSKSVSVYPVPSHSIMNFRLSQAFESEARLVISDIQGRLLSNDKFTGDMHTIDVSDFANGLYFYRIEAPGYQANGKFQVQH